MAKRRLPAGIYQRGNVYYSCFTVSGKQVRKRLSTDLEVAKVKLRKMQMRYDAGQVDNEYPVADLLGRYFRAKSQTSKASTVERYRAAIVQLLDRLQPRPRMVADVTPDMMFDYRDTRRAEGLTDVNTEFEIGRFRSALRWAARQRIIASNPLEYFDPAPAEMTEVLPFTLEHVDALIAELSDQWRPIVQIPFAIGLRVGELSGINVEDVDLDARTVSIPRRIAKRPSSIRTVPILDCVYETFQTACEGREPGAPAFETVNGNRIYAIVRERFQRAAERSGVPIREHDASGQLIAKRTFHSSRHSFATWLGERGADRELVEDLMGHKRTSMTDRYLTFGIGALRSAISKHPWGPASPPEGMLPFVSQDMHNGAGEPGLTPIAVNA